MYINDADVKINSPMTLQDEALRCKLIFPPVQSRFP